DKFAKEMELQRMQFLKTQLEITENNQEEGRRKRGEKGSLKVMMMAMSRIVAMYVGDT
ncbi:hypothetical protein Bca52824_033292, partial [Brassica carinata]